MSVLGKNELSRQEKFKNNLKNFRVLELKTLFAGKVAGKKKKYIILIIFGVHLLRADLKCYFRRDPNLLIFLLELSMFIIYGTQAKDKFSQFRDPILLTILSLALPN